MGSQPQKVQKRGNSKNDVKTAQRPLFKDLWTIFGKTNFNGDLEAKSERKIGYTRVFLSTQKSKKR